MAGDARAAEEVARKFQMPVQVDLSMTAARCSNAPGPQITMEGTMALGGLGVDLVFTNNEKGTHTYTDGVTVQETLVSAGQTMVLPKQPVLGGVGGNPFMWIQMTDENGRALTSEIFLGRCVQGAFRTSAELALPVVATAAVSASDCSNNPGPFITLDGALELSGLHGRMIFRNNDNPSGGPHRADEPMSIDTVLLQPGQAIRFPKQPVLGGVGGNPWISLQFTQGDGDAIGAEALLGRCVQLSK